MTDEQRQKLRAERFGNNETSTAAAAQRLKDEQAKILQRAIKFGVDTAELEQQKKQARAERFGVETKESLEAKKLERMRRFGLDIKNKKEGNSTRTVQDMTLEADSGKTKEELDALKAARLARFGEVDPADLRRSQSKQKDGGQRRRDKKRNQKFGKQQ